MLKHLFYLKFFVLYTVVVNKRFCDQQPVHVDVPATKAHESIA